MGIHDAWGTGSARPVLANFLKCRRGGYAHSAQGLRNYGTATSASRGCNVVRHGCYGEVEALRERAIASEGCSGKRD